MKKKKFYVISCLLWIILIYPVAELYSMLQRIGKLENIEIKVVEF